ncbi:hypothetical protein NVS55_10070 [Myxococcus stipitatus]|uniref:hypothetical protein n=1 Tax=Myxococcus stipitatus TaxID=83455 RepID=UPI00314566DB
MTHPPLRRLFATPDKLWVATFTQLRVYKGNQGLERRIDGEGERNRLTNVVLAVAPKAQRIWMGRGAQREAELFGPESHPPRIYSFAAGAKTPVTPLSVELADLVCDEQRLIGCQVDAHAHLSRILWGDLSGTSWQPLSLPEPIQVAPPEPPSASSEAGASPFEVAAGVHLSNHLHGVVAMDPGTGRIAVLRPDAPGVSFVLQFPPATRAEQWFAVPTREGMLVAFTRRGQSSTLLHYTESGALLARMETQDTTAVCGLALADADSALVVMKGHLGRLQLPAMTFVDFVAAPLEDAFRFTTATAAPGKVWIAPDHLNLGWVGRVRCEAGKPLELSLFDKPVKDGAPLWDDGRTRPCLEWSTRPPEQPLPITLDLSLAPSSSVTWRHSFQNVGTAASGLRLALGGLPLESGQVTARVRLNGEAIPLTHEPGVDFWFERRMRLDSQDSGEVEVTFHGVKAGGGHIGLTLSPWTPSRYLPDPEAFGGTHSNLHQFFNLAVSVNAPPASDAGRT